MKHLKHVRALQLHSESVEPANHVATRVRCLGEYWIPADGGVADEAVRSSRSLHEKRHARLSTEVGNAVGYPINEGRLAYGSGLIAGVNLVEQQDVGLVVVDDASVGLCLGVGIVGQSSQTPPIVPFDVPLHHAN